MAENIESNIRELEGALVRLLAFSSLTGNDISLDMATEVLRNLLKSKTPRAQLTLADITKACSDYYGISPDALQSKVRTKQSCSRAPDGHVPLPREHPGTVKSDQDPV